jgi:hypothetical protein
MADMRLTFVRQIERRSSDGRLMGLFRCSCGAETEVAIGRVKSGTTKSCGCLRREIPPNTLKHGRHGSPEYSSWTSMKRRCLDATHKDFARYGAKGITVHPEWINSFQAFFAHIGERPSGTTLDRIDGRRGYEPGNVRWATPKVQAHNRANLVLVRTAGGIVPVIEYARALGISGGAALMRLRRGKLEGATYA